MRRGARLILLLAGGDKSTQQDDIDTAIDLARDFQE
jgi:putative component of toxin-antitoxin plasmid stabilization module